MVESGKPLKSRFWDIVNDPRQGRLLIGSMIHLAFPQDPIIVNFTADYV
jgi:hypothetical protein